MIFCKKGSIIVKENEEIGAPFDTLWILAVVFSALFAGITAILSKCGIKNTNSDVATAMRTSVVLLFSWLIVLLTGAYRGISSIGATSWIFLILSGAATGASWLCYFKALSLGEASKVAAVDKSSVVLSVFFAIVLFPNERNLWQVKLVCLALIGTGTFLMTDIKKDEDGQSRAWLLFAVLSAVFAAATSLLAKTGIDGVDSNLAAAIRTLAVFVFAWGIVLGKKEWKFVKKVEKKDLVFLVLSGIATGASWLFYYYAIQNGRISVVVPIDKTSILFTVIFSSCVLKEKISKKSRFGLALLTAGAIFMAVFT